MTDYYDVSLKRAPGRDRREPQLPPRRGRGRDPGVLTDLFAEERFDLVIHLAAQAGVRYSIENPRSYLREQHRRHLRASRGGAGISARTHAARLHLLGLRRQYRDALRRDRCAPITRCRSMPRPRRRPRRWRIPMPISTICRSPCSASSRSTGPGGAPTWRSSSSPGRSSKARPIDVYNHGDMKRDFTYIDDLVDGIRKLVGCGAGAPGPAGRRDGQPLARGAVPGGQYRQFRRLCS